MAKEPLKMTSEGKMLSGVIVRHLIMPLCVSDSKSILKWFSRELPSTAYLSLMSQYTPFGKIENLPELSRPVTAREYQKVVQAARDLGIEKVFLQQRNSSNQAYIPSWDF
jgi:putative pyruvate formate lyase activating enzyme